MKRYKKKPIAVECCQFTGDNLDKLVSWIKQNRGSCVVFENSRDSKKTYISLTTLEGPFVVRRLDWVIRGVHSEFYRCDRDVFADSYEEVS
jgi:hypothetical protein